MNGSMMDVALRAAADECDALKAENSRLHRELEAAREQSDHGGYCNLHGRHLGYKCPECPYEDRIAELERELEAARALIERKDASMKQDADVFCAHTDMNVKRLAELEHQLAGFRWHRVDEGLPPEQQVVLLTDGSVLDLTHRDYAGWVGGFEPTHWREIGELPSALPTGASE